MSVMSLYFEQSRETSKQHILLKAEIESSVLLSFLSAQSRSFDKLDLFLLE